MSERDSRLSGTEETVPVAWFWRRGPKHGIARGVAVFGPPGFDEPDLMARLLAGCQRLRAWASERGVPLDDDPTSLVALDRLLDVAAADPEIGAGLSNDVGLYLGTVIVAHVPGARWYAWPNGHPVIRVQCGDDLDVLALVERRLTAHGADLAAIYAAAASR